jgi:hypothetical protein
MKTEQAHVQHCAKRPLKKIEDGEIDPSVVTIRDYASRAARRATKASGKSGALASSWQ